MLRFRISAVLITVCTLALILGAYLSTEKRAMAQTIPTRTPTPKPSATFTPTDDPPTATPDSDDSDPGTNPGPTNTPISLPSATSTTIVLPPTLEGGFLPTAEACSTEPTVFSTNSGVNVRSGPSLDYEVVDQLIYTEVRPISGRAQYARWWQIVLADGTLVWVADRLVQVQGYTGAVPIVPAPPLENGSTPTPGTPWAPTPVPNCTPPPTATSSTTPTATETAEDSGEGPDANQALGSTASPTPTETASPTPSRTVTPTVEAEAPSATATLAPLAGEAESSAEGGVPWLPLAGLGLILIAGVLFVTRRNGE